MSGSRNSRIGSYRALIRRFLKREIEASDFQRLYLRKFKAEAEPFGERDFLLLDELFGHVHVFSPEPEMVAELKREQPGWYLDEDELRAQAERILGRL